MYNVYIRNFLDSSGSIVSGKQLMFSIPTGSKEGLPVTNAQISSSEGSADSFNFTMEPNSPYYSSLIQMKTLLQVVYDGTTIFFGRVLTVNKSTVFQSKQVHCEGALGFLNDTFYEGVKEELVPQTSIKEYYKKLIENHNSYIGSSANYSWKRFDTASLSVPSSIKSVSKKHEPTSWTDTSSLVRDLTSSYGGYIQSVYSDDKNKLEWYRYYRHDGGDGNRPVVELGKNLIDFSDSSEVDNIFTRLIPVGSSKKDGSTIYVNGKAYTDINGTSRTHGQKYINVSLMTSLYSKSALNEGFHNYNDYVDPEGDYTPIYKTQNFPNANTQDKLWDYAIDYIKNNYYKAASTYSIKAIDMHVLNPDTAPKILLGEVVDLKYPEFVNGEPKNVKRKLVCKSVQFDLLNPEKNSYSFGVPNELLDHEYGEKEKKKSGKQQQSVSGHTGGGGIPKQKEENELTFESIARTVGEVDGLDAYDYMIAQGPMSGSIYCYDPSETNDPSHNQDLWVMTTIVGKCSASLGVGFAQKKGIFAFTWNMGVPKKIHHYYTKYGEDSEKTYSPPNQIIVQNIFSKVAESGGKIKSAFDGVKLALEGVSSIFRIGHDEKAGRDSNGDPKPTVEINSKGPYTDSNGKVTDRYGFIRAIDFSTPDYESLKVKILSVQNLYAQRIEALEAYVAVLKTVISSSLVVNAASVNAGEVNVTSTVNAFSFNYTGNQAKIQKCFNRVQVGTIGGRKAIILYRADGSDSDYAFID